MRTHAAPSHTLRPLALGAILALAASASLAQADDKPAAGAPLEISPTETEQPVPLAYLDPGTHLPHCVNIKIHWTPSPQAAAEDDPASFTLDLPADNPGVPVFTAQLWNASLASSFAWQQPWQGAHWKILQTPVTDGTGIDAALAVGMIATSARRHYPESTVVIGSLNPDGSLGPVSHLLERIDAAAAAGMTRAIIPAIQRFDTDSSGQVVNIVRHAADLHVECLPVDNLVEATETVMSDPLPDAITADTTPKYSNDVANYIDEFAHREQATMEGNLKFAPKETDLTHFPTRLSAIWKSVYADANAARQAYRAGQVYVAYRLFARANGAINGANALASQTPASFDVKTALAASTDLRTRLHTLMNPPTIDQGELQSAVLVAEMADWAYDTDASLEDAQLVTKQTYSQRTDATPAEKDRARETILYANEQAKYLIEQSTFFTGLAAHIGKNNPLPVDENANRLLPQLIPAQLAIAHIFTDGLRDRAGDLRDGLLFDPRLAAYMNVLRDVKTTWETRQRQAAADAATPKPAPGPIGPTPPASPDATAVKPNTATTTPVAFEPGNAYTPPNTAVATPATPKKLSAVALCLVWVNHDCEIATLDEKYLRLNGTIDTATHEWHLKDRLRLDALLQSAETGARQGIACAQKAQVDPSILAMIYERAAYLRIQPDDASALEALRQYWRCALIGNMCWQLAHISKAHPVDVATQPAPPTPTAPVPPKPPGTNPPTPNPPTPNNPTATNPPAANTVPPAPPATNPPTAPPAASIAINPVPPVVTPAPPATVNPPIPPIVHPPTPTAIIANHTPPEPQGPIEPPIAPIVHDPANSNPPHALPVIEDATGPPIPVAPIAHDPTSTNAPPIIGPVQDNADGHSNAFP